MAKWIKNDDTIAHTYLGQQIAAGEYYEIKATEELKWSCNSTLLKDIANGVAVVAKDDSGNSDITQICDALSYMYDNVPQTRLNSLSQDKYATKDTGTSFTVPNGTTHTEDTLIDFKYLRGGLLETLNHKFPGDKVTIQVIDIDNVLGYGANVVINEFIKDRPIKKDGSIELKSHAISNPLPAGLYTRCIITSTGTTDVEVGLTFYGYNDA